MPPVSSNTVLVRTAPPTDSFTTGAGVPNKYTITDSPDGTEIPKADLEAVIKEAADNGVRIIDMSEEASSA